MKKATIILIISILLSGCVTNEYTKADDDAGKGAGPGNWAWATAFIPGLTQLLNEEYLEAAIYAAASFGPMLLAQQFGSFETYEPYPGQDIPFYAFWYGGSLVWAWQFADAVIDSGTRAERHRRFLVQEMNITPQEKIALENGQIFIGMSEDVMLMVVGKPVDVNSSTGTWGIHNQYVFEKPNKDRFYVYTENGKVTSWQE